MCVCVCHTCYSAGHTPITTTMRSCLIYTSNITALTTNTSTCLAWYSFHCMGSCWGRHLRMVTEGLHQRSTKFGRATSRMRCFGILVKTENRRSAEGWTWRSPRVTHARRLDETAESSNPRRWTEGRYERGLLGNRATTEGRCWREFQRARVNTEGAEL